MISELKKRSTTGEGPAITMFRVYAGSFSYQVLGGGSLAMNSGDCRVCTVNRSTKPSSVGREQNLRRIGDRVRLAT